MIDEEATFAEFGYRSTDLKPKSHKRIVVRCEMCKRTRTIMRCDYTNTQSYRKDKLSLCTSCAISKYSNTPRGKDSVMFGVPKSAETKRRLSKALTGKPGIWKGKKLPPEMCKKISENHADFSKENHPNWKPRIVKTCDYCGIDYEVERWQEPRSRFCSMKCSRSYFVGENSPVWQGGKCSNIYCKLWNEELRESTRDKYGRTCFICGKTEEDNNRKLDVHHIDMNKQQGCNGNEWKLVPLCRSCHGKTQHNRFFWFSLITQKLDLEFSADFACFAVAI